MMKGKKRGGGGMNGWRNGISVGVTIGGILVSRGVITSRGVDYTVSGQERASAQLGPPMMQGPPVPPPSGHILAF